MTDEYAAFRRRRAATRAHVKRQKTIQRLLERSSLGDQRVTEVIQEGKRRAAGQPTMTEQEYLKLIDESLE